MTYDEWLEKYKPVQNHIDDNASMDGKMFETYGNEELFVRAQKESRIWTIVTGDDGDDYLVDGFHFVNRMGYMIASVSREAGASVEINLDED